METNKWDTAVDDITAISELQPTFGTNTTNSFVPRRNWPITFVRNSIIGDNLTNWLMIIIGYCVAIRLTIFYVTRGVYQGTSVIIL